MRITHVSSRVSRGLVIAAGLVTFGTTGAVWYARAMSADPVRLSRDADGVVRLMTRAELLDVKLAAARERAAAAPDDAQAAQTVLAWEHALETEKTRLAAAGVQPRGPASADDLTL